MTIYEFESTISIDGPIPADARNATSIVIPASVKSIGDNAFHDCTNLTTVEFETGSVLETIGKKAFENCSSLTSIVIPASVKSIGDNAFHDCRNLTTVEFETGSVLETIGKKAFENCSSLTSIVIPASVKSIGDNAFHFCTKLTTVEFETGSVLETIGKLAFMSNLQMTSIVIPAKVISIGDNAFEQCHRLTTVEFETGSVLETIGKEAFMSNLQMTSIVIPAKVESIGDKALLNCIRLTTVEFETGSVLETIGKEAFRYCYGLTSISIPALVTGLGTSDSGAAFSNCVKLRSVEFESNGRLEMIPRETFSDCSKLEKIVIPQSVKEIDDLAFAGCESLTLMVIPSDVTTIHKNVFGSDGGNFPVGTVIININAGDTWPTPLFSPLSEAGKPLGEFPTRPGVSDNLTVITLNKGIPKKSSLELGTNGNYHERREDAPTDLLINLSNTNLYGYDLSNVNLRGVNLTGADLSGAVLSDANLSDAVTGPLAPDSTAPTHLPTNYKVVTGGTGEKWLVGPGAVLTGAVLTGAVLTDAVLTGAVLTGADLTDAVLTNADLTGAVLTGVKSGGITPSDGATTTTLPTDYIVKNGYIIGAGVDLTGANLSGADLTDAVLTGVKSGGITPSDGATTTTLPTDYIVKNGYIIGPGVDLKNAVLTDAVLTDAVLTGADLTDAVLTGVKSGGITPSDGTTTTLPTDYIVKNGYIIGPGVDLKNAVLTGSVLTGAVLTDAVLTGAVLTGAVLTDAVLTGADLSGVKSTGIIPSNSDGTNVALDAGVIIRNGYIIGAGVDLKNAVLTDAVLTGAVLTDAVLTGADLSGVKSTGIIPSNSDGTNVTLDAGVIIRNGYIIGPGVDLKNAVLTGAVLTGADLSGVKSTGIIPSNSDGTNVALDAGVIIRNGYIIGAGVDLKNAVLTGSVLTDAVLTDAVLTNADLTGVKSGGITPSDGTTTTLPTDYIVKNGYIIGPGVDLKNAVLTGADLKNAVLTNADLTDAVLTGVKSGGITPSDGTTTTLPTDYIVKNGYIIGAGVDLKNAVLTNADLTGADLTDAVLTNADLTGAVLSGAEVGPYTVGYDGNGLPKSLDKDGNVEYTLTVQETQVDNGTVQRADAVIFSAGQDTQGYKIITDDSHQKWVMTPGADLSGANLSGANLFGANLQNAILSEETTTGPLIGVPTDDKLPDNWVTVANPGTTAATITGVTKSSTATVVTTRAPHGFSTGNKVTITGVVGMAELNNREFTVANANAADKTFELKGVNSSDYGEWKRSATIMDVTNANPAPTAATITNVTKADPAVVTTSAAHGFSNGDKVTITGVVGMTELNDLEFTVTTLTATTFQLDGVDSSGYDEWEQSSDNTVIVLSATVAKVKDYWLIGGTLGLSFSTLYVADASDDHKRNQYNDNTIALGIKKLFQTLFIPPNRTTIPRPWADAPGHQTDSAYDGKWFVGEPPPNFILADYTNNNTYNKTAQAPLSEHLSRKYQSYTTGTPAFTVNPPIYDWHRYHDDLETQYNVMWTNTSTNTRTLSNLVTSLSAAVNTLHGTHPGVTGKVGRQYLNHVHHLSSWYANQRDAAGFDLVPYFDSDMSAGAAASLAAEHTAAVSAAVQSALEAKQADRNMPGYLAYTNSGTTNGSVIPDADLPNGTQFATATDNNQIVLGYKVMNQITSDNNTQYDNIVYVNCWIDDSLKSSISSKVTFLNCSNSKESLRELYFVGDNDINTDEHSYVGKVVFGYAESTASINIAAEANIGGTVFVGCKFTSTSKAALATSKVALLNCSFVT